MGSNPTQADTMRFRQNGRHYAYDIFKLILLNENVSNLFQISLNFVPKGPNYIKSSFVRVMVWQLTGYKLLNQWWLRSLNGFTRPQWVKHWQMKWITFEQICNHISTVFKLIPTNKWYLRIYELSQCEYIPGKWNEKNCWVFFFASFIWKWCEMWLNQAISGSSRAMVNISLTSL